ncbi:MAG: membrane protein insertion efficiency factor YidD [Clostridiales bacterium]|nr:membrane protein insertion efficiency factor YidD [Clostridiales bacterium]
MRIIIKILEFPFKMLFLFLITIYKYCISPLIPNTCRFYPTCSQYAVQAIKEYGAFKGLRLAIKRILRCNPKSECGFDPLPPNIKGDIKWLI